MKGNRWGLLASNRNSGGDYFQSYGRKARRVFKKQLFLSLPWH
jgi:hypothetical protein